MLVCLGSGQSAPSRILLLTALLVVNVQQAGTSSREVMASGVRGTDCVDFIFVGVLGCCWYLDSLMGIRVVLLLVQRIKPSGGQG